MSGNKIIFTHLFYSVRKRRVGRWLSGAPPAAKARWSGNRLHLVRRRLVLLHRGRSGAANLLYKNNFIKKCSYLSLSPQFHTVPK